MAEWILRRMLERGGSEQASVESAGVFAIEGMTATRETLRVLQDVGIDASSHRARVLTPEMIQSADYVFVMEPFHAEEVVRRVPVAREKTHLLKAYGLRDAGESLAIPDPIGKPLEVYEVCFAEIREAAERVARSLGAHTT
jgi:protein-tyrosine-phosphatase